MSLTKYKTKRNFKASPEPVGGRAGKNDLRFVVQKHDATRLHYDVRFEMEGILKSWAVPRGPSTDPRVKRLAMMVEDHPYDYRDFEGIIPSGYGAGTVMVWDEGTYSPADFDKTDKASQDKYLRAGLKAGKLHMILNGKKLKGEFALVKTQGIEKNAWLMFKIKDQFASTKDVTLKNKSVISNKTLAEITKDARREDGTKNTVKPKVIHQNGKDFGPHTGKIHENSGNKIKQENIAESQRRNPGKKNQRPRHEVYQPQQNLLAKRKNYQEGYAQLLLPGGTLYSPLPERPAAVHEPSPRWYCW
jgi:bifunctional non-homologous end joining protein LigD